MNQESNKNFRKVETFDPDLLRQAFTEGRLFIVPREESAQDLRERGIRSILDYVGRIDEYTSSEYRPYIRNIWEQILHDVNMGELFFYTRYASNRGQVNWYRVTVVVCLLHEWQVYSNDLSACELHCIMEGSEKRNGRYTGMSRYQLERRHLKLLRTKLPEIQQ